jgi:hypothetical protein
MRMPGVEMVDRHPIEPHAEVLLHLSHHIPGEGPQVGKAVAVLRDNDEAELMPIPPATFCECVTSAAPVSAAYSRPRSRVVPSRCE